MAKKKNKKVPSDQFYPVRLNPQKQAAGRFFDPAQAGKTRKRKG